jgi:hypothetical protein
MEIQMIKLTAEEMRSLRDISKDERVSFTLAGKRITYKALPYPLPETFQTQLKAMGRRNGECPPGDIVGIYMLEKKMRSMFGTYVTRPFIEPQQRLSIYPTLIE